jgi:hypothetical protein
LAARAATGVPCEGQKVKVVRVLEDLLCKVRVRRRQGLREIRLRSPLAAMEATLDLVHEDTPAPAVLHRGPHVPFPVPGVFHQIEYSDIMTPRNLSNNLLDK